MDVYLANGCFSEEILLKRNFAYFVWVYLRTLSRHSRLGVLRGIEGRYTGRVYLYPVQEDKVLEVIVRCREL